MEHDVRWRGATEHGARRVVTRRDVTELNGMELNGTEHGASRYTHRYATAAALFSWSRFRSRNGRHD